MTTGPSAYTPLESFLLFQYLSIYGVNSDSFGRISEILKNDPQIKRSGNYEPGRLGRDALREFFLALLKEEARTEVNNTSGADNDGQHADAQPNSRKRKAPSPHLPTVQEALKDAHLIPPLIHKLYSRYREHAIIEIREDERRYERLEQDIKDIEAGEWDKKLQQQLDGGELDEILEKKQLVNGAVSGQDSTQLSPGTSAAARTERSAESPPQRQSRSPQPPRPSHIQLASSQGPHTPQAPSTYHVQALAVPQPPYTQHPPNDAPSAQSPRSAIAQSPGMPPPPLPSLAYAVQQPYGAHNGLRPVAAQSPYAQTGSVLPQSSPPSGYHQPYPNQQSGYFPQTQYAAPVYPPHRGGVQLPPFQVSPQTPPATKQQTQQQSTHGMLRPMPPKAGDVVPPTSAQARSSAMPLDVARLLLITASPQGPTKSTPSSTRWKPSSLSGPPIVLKSPTRPPSRSVSPVSDREGTQEPSPATTTKPNARRTRSNQAQTTRSVSVSEGPGQAAKATRTQGKRVRGGSTTSSAVGSSARGRTRSQSVISHASIDNESVTGRKVKHEPSTPMEITETVEGTPGSSGTRRALPRSTSKNKRKRSLRATSEASDSADVHHRPLSAAPKDNVLAVRNFSRLAMPIIENDIMSHKHASLFSNPVRERDAQGYRDMIRRPQDMKSIKAAITAGVRAVNAAIAEDDSIPTYGPRDTSNVLLPISEDLVPPKGIVNSAQLEREVMRMFANAVMFNPGEDDVVQDAREMYESAAVSISNFRNAERTAAADSEKRKLEESEADELGQEDEEMGGMTEKGKRRRLG